MDEIISYKMCAVKVRNAKLRNCLKAKCDSFRLKTIHASEIILPFETVQKAPKGG